ncbi:MAG: glycosyltransferase [Chitinivibrionales bacterium]|nr:glycosyltransferase [Chitinivibrionales bacterium]
MDPSQPLISVVIPTYNRRSYITEAIDSVLAQTYDDYEVVVVDDGSTDGTREALEQYAHAIRYVYQENAGCAAARNTGLEHARGRWIAFLDSDDVWLPDKLATQAADLQHFPAANAHALNAHIYRDHIGQTVDLFRYIGYEHHLQESPTFITRPLEQQLRYGFGWPQSVMTRRDVLVQAGPFNGRLKLHMDTDMFYRVAAHGKWVINAQPLVQILRREEAPIEISRQTVEKRVSARREMVLACRSLVAQRNLTPRETWLARRFLGVSLSALGIEQCRQRESPTEARRNLLHGFILLPTPASFMKMAMGCLCGLRGVEAVSTWQRLKRAFRDSLRDDRIARVPATAQTAAQARPQREQEIPHVRG